jgi:hypothetical protein
MDEILLELDRLGVEYETIECDPNRIPGAR